jgi:CubicO group peptidase (beta-lactamase class C family)
MSPALKVEVDPAEVGMDAGRLQRIGNRMRAYVDQKLMPGWTVVVARHGQVAYLEHCGQRDMEAGLPVEGDTIFRIYSMTKPITAVAAMMLWEEGGFELRDPVAKYIPAFADTRVWRGGTNLAPVTQPMVEPMAVWHLFTHTAGLTYGFAQNHPVDAIYRASGYEWGQPAGMDLEGVCNHLATMPLLFEPGSEWNYSMATDVLGRVVEVVSGMTLDRFMEERIFRPLGMVDTAFGCPAEDHGRLAALYSPTPGTKVARRIDVMGNAALTKPLFLGGGGGLVSTAHAYHRFQQMLASGGLAPDGTRLLSPNTIAYMASNHLPGNADLRAYGRPLFAETAFDGVGFGLGVSVTIDPVAAKVPGSVGDYGWGGAASTWMMIDPVEDLTVLFMTQLLPSSTHPVRSQLKQLVHQAIID